MEILGITVGILMAMWIVGFILSMISEDEEVATFTAKIYFAAMVLGGILFIWMLIDAIFN